MHAHHVERRDAFGDADDERHARVGRFHDRVGRERRRHEDHRASAPVAFTACSTVSKIGKPSTSVPPLPGVTPPTIFVPYSRQRLGVELPGRAGDALDDDARVPVDEDAHLPPPRSLRGGDGELRALGHVGGGLDREARTPRGSPCRARRWCPPGGRRAAPRARPRFAAATTPSARTSQRRMPPKMLMKIAFTFGSESRMRNAWPTFFWSAPPPTSRKLAGSPPANLMMSIVAIARPAPFTMQPMLPSSAM